MTYLQIDARGKSCPEPVLLTKRAVEKGPKAIVVLVDNTTARDNVTRFAKHAGYKVDIAQDGTDYRMALSK